MIRLPNFYLGQGKRQDSKLPAPTSKPKPLDRDQTQKLEN